MNLYNIKHRDDKVDLIQAILKGIGRDNGLYMPEALPFFDNINELLAYSFHDRTKILLNKLLHGVLVEDIISDIVDTSFDFPLELRKIERNIYALELFHGPSLAFKDFGARFMANVLTEISQEKVTIVTATSGDTGAAVAKAFHNVDNVDVYILYPYKKISELQEAMFCTLGDNITTIAVDSDFDACQELVKRCLNDSSLGLNINSANSINICRLLAQLLYYFEAVAKAPRDSNITISVPCGNFGNITSSLFAKAMGLPINHFVAATNANDTVPRYLATDNWQPEQTKATISNAMDVSSPNNWPRVEEICRLQGWKLKDLISALSVSEQETKLAMQQLYQKDYIADPHTAIAYKGLIENLKQEQTGIFLCTAHPVKFKSTVDDVLGIDYPIPKDVQALLAKKNLSIRIPNDYDSLKQIL